LCFIPLHLQLLSALLLQADLQRSSSLQSFPRSTQYIHGAPFHCITQVDYIHRRTKAVIEFAARHLVRGFVTVTPIPPYTDLFLSLSIRSIHHRRYRHFGR
jgi:hypothetical protein